MTRVSLVTGAAHGIGRAIAARLARDGTRVVIADRDEAAGAAAAATIGARFIAADISREPDILAVIASISSIEGRLDTLVCNAGINVKKPISALSLAEWNLVIATNLTSIFLLARAAEALLRAAHGNIVTIASTRAHMSEPNTEAYAASKGGLLALTHALAISLGPEVRVNCVSPGWIHVRGAAPRADEEKFHPAGRVGRAEDVAALVAFLSGPEAGFFTGAEFIVDGGVTKKMIYPD